MLSKKAQAAMQKVVEQFQAGDLSPVVKMAKTLPPADAPAFKWSFSNRVLAAATTGGNSDCRGFKQWAKVGRKVKPGSGYILGPRIKKEKNDKGEEVEVFCGFIGIPVWGYTQTFAEDESAFTYEPKELPPLMGVAIKFGIDVQFVPTGPTSLGNCDTDGKTIRIGASNHSVFFHEFAHAVHARIGGKLKGGQHVDQETVAEFTATVLMAIYGYDYTGNAWEYIKMYASEPIRAIQNAMGTVERVLEEIEK